ncbi:trimethylamine methyltransferase family protein [Sporomusa sp. KB1]|jgi:trimethylamine--corrinoid protein Co-methyltransferase|uniref:[trimethylamine--corrinoid protein] Co-methyltransferase n=1 Tax=Sporomusa sp. KB1 TaxID=943346 RepID=UPI0011A6FB78|nr:trimethylamine methyltransferase family protein [Sporomusa sp. KB1]TWH45117.1 trimethylamine--corrinoid protein Co-methyltransferase [Sporomusa sp. KB1]
MQYHQSENWSFWGRNMFSDYELEAIHETSLEILSSTGIYVEEQDARDYFAAAGAKVDHDKHLVKIPKWLVQEAIFTAPSSFVLAGREPKFDYPLGIGKVGFANVGIAVSVNDLNTGKNRPSIKKDLADYAHLIDQLDNIVMCWDCIMPNDVPTETVGLYALQAHVNNTRKHIMATTFDKITAQAAVAMAAEVAGGMDALSARPLISAGSCPKSPLTFSTAVTACIIEFAKASLPVMAMSMVLAGATGPVTLAGTLALHNAEILAALTLTQIVKKGCPFWYGSCTSIMDLRKAAAATGCAEHAMFGAAIARMAQFYNLPCVAPGTWTDSKTTDVQAGYEKGISSLLPALAGANIIFGSGGLAGGMAVDFGSIVTENDMFKTIQFILKGIPVNKESLALELIQRIGPKGEYLSHEHTLKNMRSCQVWPDLFDREPTSVWEAAGSKTLDTKGREKAAELINNENPAPLPKNVQKRLADIINDVERELSVKK